MWPFKSKKQEAEEIWRALRGEVDHEKTMKKISNHISSGNYDEVEKLTTQLIESKVREIERINSKN